MSSKWKKSKPKDLHTWYEILALTNHKNECIARQAEIKILLNAYSSKDNQDFDELLKECDELQNRIHNYQKLGAVDYVFDFVDKDEVLENSTNRVLSPMIDIPPGYRLLDLSGLLFGKKTKELVFEPWVADLQEEYLDAAMRGKEWQCRIIRIRAVITAIHLALAVVCSSTLKRLIAFWKIT